MNMPIPFIVLGIHGLGGRCKVDPSSTPVMRENSSTWSVDSSAEEGETGGQLGHRLAVDEATEVSADIKQRIVANVAKGMSMVSKV